MGCVEVVISPESLNVSDTWTPTSLNGGVWRTNSGLHVGWKVYLPVGDAGNSYRAWLFVATFDPTNGALKKLRRYAPLPAGVLSDTGDIQGISGSDTEVFAAGLRSWDTAANPRSETLFQGNLDDDSAQVQVDLGWPADSHDITDVGWDGEAFAVHSRNNATGEVFVARASPSGQLVLGSTKFGVTPSPGGMILGYRMSTDATSGTSYLFDTPGGGRFLGGHDRTGVAFPWSASGPLDVMIPGVTGIAADSPGIASEPDGGAWAVWSQSEASGNYTNVASHLTGSGQLDQSFVFESPNPSPTVNTTPPPVVGATSAASMWMAKKVNQQIHIHEIDNQTLAPPKLLYDNPYYDGMNPSQTFVGIQFMEGFEWQRERWIMTVENFLGGSTVIHVMKASGDCEYIPATRPEN